MEGLRRLILALVIVHYIICIHHFRQTIHFENEAQLRLENNVLMHWRQDSSGEGTHYHSVAGYGSWVNPIGSD